MPQSFKLTDVTALRFECGEGDNVRSETITIGELVEPMNWVSRVFAICGGDAIALRVGKEEWQRVWDFARALGELAPRVRDRTLKVPLNIQVLVG